MQVYSINSDNRHSVVKAVLSVSFIIAFIIVFTYPLIFGWLYKNFFSDVNLEQLNIILNIIKVLFNISIPITFYGFFMRFYNEHFWKYLYKWHKIPDLNGKWTGTVVSPVKNNGKPVTIDMKIIQTWNKISITTQTGGSVGKSETVMIDSSLTETKLKYSFRIERKGQPTYIGYNELIFNRDELKGDYFTGKPLEGKENEGKGTKGEFTVRKICCKKSCPLK